MFNLLSHKLLTFCENVDYNNLSDDGIGNSRANACRRKDI